MCSVNLYIRPSSPRGNAAQSTGTFKSSCAFLERESIPLAGNS